jgi:hypothetical protein
MGNIDTNSEHTHILLCLQSMSQKDLTFCLKAIYDSLFPTCLINPNAVQSSNSLELYDDLQLVVLIMHEHGEFVAKARERLSNQLKDIPLGFLKSIIRKHRIKNLINYI